jgi:hypothetical protein
MGLDDLSAKQVNQVNISLEAWCIKNLQDAWGDHALHYLVAMINGLSPENFKFIYDEADRLASEVKARKNA